MSERDSFIQWADENGLDLHPGRFCEFLLADTAAAYRAWQARADLAAQREAELMEQVERLRNERNAVRVKYEQPLLAEVGRLRKLVESAFSEGFWNGLCTCRELTDDDWKRLKKQGWQSSKTYKALRSEAKEKEDE